MHLARLTVFASMGLILFLTAGCYSPYATPYGSTYGAPYGAPVQTLTPGAPYTPYPQGTYPQGTPGAFPPGSETYSTPTPTPSGQNSPFYPNNTSSFPPYDSGVPKYPDPGEGAKFQQNSSPKPIAGDDFNLDEHGSLDGVGATANVAKVPLDAAEFQKPQLIRSQTPRPIDDLAITVAPGAPSPFAHDADGYRWLRGLVRRNTSTGAWSVIYNTIEMDSDPFHGWLTLAADPRLAQLAPNGAYLIKGQLDRTTTDSSGKPLYRVESITPWQPSGAL